MEQRMLNLHCPTPVFSSDRPFFPPTVNFASAGTPCTFVQYSCRDRLLFFAVLWDVSSVQSSPVWLNASTKGEQGGSLSLQGVPVEAEEACIWLKKLFSSLSADQTVHQVFIRQRLKSLNSGAIQSLRNNLLLLSWTNSSPYPQLGGASSSCSKKGHVAAVWKV